MRFAFSFRMLSGKKNVWPIVSVYINAVKSLQNLILIRGHRWVPDFANSLLFSAPKMLIQTTGAPVRFCSHSRPGLSGAGLPSPISPSGKIMTDSPCLSALDSALIPWGDLLSMGTTVPNPNQLRIANPLLAIFERREKSVSTPNVSGTGLANATMTPSKRLTWFAHTMTGSRCKRLTVAAW